MGNIKRDGFDQDEYKLCECMREDYPPELLPTKKLYETCRRCDIKLNWTEPIFEDRKMVVAFWNALCDKNLLLEDIKEVARCPGCGCLYSRFYTYE